MFSSQLGLLKLVFVGVADNHGATPESDLSGIT